MSRSLCKGLQRKKRDATTKNCTRLREHCKLRLRENSHENERTHAQHGERRLVADLVMHAARGGGELVASICAWRRPREVSRAARARLAVLMARAMTAPDPSELLFDASE